MISSNRKSLGLVLAGTLLLQPGMAELQAKKTTKAT